MTTQQRFQQWLNGDQTPPADMRMKKRDWLKLTLVVGPVALALAISLAAGVGVLVEALK